MYYICCICGHREESRHLFTFLFNDRRGDERILCAKCAAHVERIENAFTGSDHRESFLYIRDLCYNRKLRDPEVVRHLNAHVLWHTPDRLPIIITDLIDVLNAAIKVMRWLLFTAVLVFGSAFSGMFAFTPYARQEPWLFLLLAAGMFLINAIIAFALFSALKVLGDWLYYYLLVRDFKKRNKNI